MYKNLRYGSYTKWPQTEIHLLWPIWLWRMVILPLASKRSWPTFPRMSRSWSKSVTWKWGGKHHQDLKINGCFNVESDAKPQIWGFACFSDNPIFSWWLPHSENRVSTHSEVSSIGDSEHQFFGKFCGVSQVSWRFHGGLSLDWNFWPVRLPLNGTDEWQKWNWVSSEHPHFRVILWVVSEDHQIWGGRMLSCH